MPITCARTSSTVHAGVAGTWVLRWSSSSDRTRSRNASRVPSYRSAASRCRSMIMRQHARDDRAILPVRDTRDVLLRPTRDVVGDYDTSEPVSSNLINRTRSAATSHGAPRTGFGRGAFGQSTSMLNEMTWKVVGGAAGAGGGAGGASRVEGGMEGDARRGATGEPREPLDRLARGSRLGCRVRRCGACRPPCSTRRSGGMAIGHRRLPAEVERSGAAA